MEPFVFAYLDDIIEWSVSGTPPWHGTLRPEPPTSSSPVAFAQEVPEVGLETRTSGCIRELNARLTEAPVLACPDFSEKLVLQTDASDCGLGAVLTQQHQGAER
ncbi:hypothetical protein ACLKA6_006016 [Drosophila palustris]